MNTKSKKVYQGFVKLTPSDDKDGVDESKARRRRAAKRIGKLAKRLSQRVQAFLPQKKLASKTYRFLARQIVSDLAGIESTPKIVFSSTGDLDLNSEILLMLAYFLQDEYGCNVLLIDGTFRKGGISDRLGINNPVGFMDYLCGEHWKPNPLITGTANKNIFVMPAGSTPFLGPQFLERGLLESRLQTAARGFRYLFLQQDCILNDSRYLGLNQVCDLVLLHAVERETRLQELEECQKLYEDQMIHNVRLILSE